MSEYNNFDMSSSGVNITINVSYDNELSQMDFNDTIEQEDGVNYFTANGDKSTDDFKMLLSDEMLSKTDRQIRHACVDWVIKNRLDKWCELDFDEVKQEINNFKYYNNGATYLTTYLEEWHGAKDDDYFRDVLNCNLLKANFEQVTITGCVQGDVATVLYIKDESFPLTMSADNIRDHLTNLFYRSPISGSIVIGDNEDEFYITDYIDYYSYWDKNDFMKAFRASEDSKRLTPEALNQIEAILPNELEYV